MLSYQSQSTLETYLRSPPKACAHSEGVTNSHTSPSQAISAPKSYSPGRPVSTKLVLDAEQQQYLQHVLQQQEERMESKEKADIQDGKSVPLTPEQQRVIDLVVKDRLNIFFTGSAGTGLFSDPF